MARQWADEQGHAPHGRASGKGLAHLIADGGHDIVVHERERHHRQRRHHRGHVHVREQRRIHLRGAEGDQADERADDADDEDGVGFLDEDGRAKEEGPAKERRTERDVHSCR